MKGRRMETKEEKTYTENDLWERCIGAFIVGILVATMYVNYLG